MSKDRFGTRAVLGLALALLAGRVPAAIRSAAPVREISVRALIDEGLGHDPRLEDAFRESFAAASRELEEAAAVRLHLIGVEDWSSKGSLHTLESLADDLDAHREPEGADVLLTLTGRKDLEAGLSGFSMFKEGLVVVRLSPDRQALTRTLLHEFGHLLGAVHVAESASVMSYDSQSLHFDRLNIQAMELGRSRTFHTVAFPIPRDLLARAASVYETIAATVRLSLAQDRDGRAASGARLRLGERSGRHLDDVYVMLAQVYLETREYEKMASACRSGLAINSRDLELQMLLGISMRRMGRVEEAIDQYREVLKRDPKLADVHYNLGIAYAKLGRRDEARVEYQAALALKPNRAEVHHNLGELLLRMDDLDGAEREIRRAITLCGEYPLAHSNLAELLCRRGRYDEALAEADRAAAQDPGLPDPENIRGNIFRRLGRDEEAVEAYRKAIVLDPAYDKAYFNLGVCLLDGDCLEEAGTQFLKALELNPNFAEARADLGYCRLRAGDPDRAIAELERAQKLGLNSVKVHINLGSAYLLKGQADKAVREARAALDLDPGSALAHNNLGLALHALGRGAEAADHFLRAIGLDASYRDPLFNLASLRFQAGDPAAALDLYLKAEPLGRPDGALLNNIAVLLFRKGEYGRSWTYVQKARAAGFKVHPDFLEELKKKIK
jgi:Flp pilus assembly protein TadD